MRTRALFIFMVVALTALISSMAWAQVTLPITETFDESWTAATSGFTLTTGTWTCSSTVPTRNTTATYNYSSSTAGCKLSSAGVYLVTPQLSGGIGTVTFYQSSGGTSSRYISVYKSTDGTTYSFVQKCSTSAAAATLMTVAVNDVNAKYLKFNDSTSSVYIDQITIAAWTAPTVTTDAVNSYAQTTASIGATISSLGLTSITSYGVCYSSSSATPTISDTKIETGTSFTATGSYTSSITGLKPSTTYYVRAYATNTQGTSYGSALSFTTSAATYTNYYNVSGSDVSVLTNWGTNTDGTGTNPSNFTTDFQLFNITNSGATLGSAWIVSGSASKVIIGDGTNAASLIIPSSYALTGTVDVTASGTLTVQNATAPTLGTLNASSTVVFDGIAAVAGSYGNLTLANAATLPSGTVTIAGTFTPGTTTSASSGIVAFNGSSTQTIPAFTYSSLTASNDATIAAGTTVAVNNALTVATSKTLTVNGTLQSTYTGSTTPFTISGTLVFGSTGVYDLAAAATTTAVYIPTATWNAGSTAKITGIVGVATTDYTLLNGVSQSFSNFTINAPSLLGKIVLQQVSAFGSASGTFTVTSTGTGSLQTSYSSAANSGLTVANYVQAAGTVYIVNNSSSTVNRSVTVSGAFTLNGGTFIIAQYKATTTGKSSLLIGGNLTIASGATLSKDITTYGDYGTAFVSLNGTTAQTITNNGTLNGKINFTINNPAGITLASDITTISDTVTITNGTVSGGGLFGIAYTTGATLVYNGTSAQTTGDEALYNLNNLTISNASGVTLSKATTINGLLSISTGATLNLGTYSTTANQLSLGGVGQTATGTWGSTLSGASNISDTYFASTAGTVTIATALPVELTSFTAVSAVLNASLSWKTATETNNAGFAIERRTSGSSTWSQIGYVNGNGTSALAHSYSYTDASASAGTYVYRLKQIDNDGTSKYSNESEVVVGAAAKALTLGNYPNPFNPSTSILFSVQRDGNTVVKVFNILGQEVATAFTGVATAGQYYKASFNGSRLASGVYYYSIENNGQRMVKKMLMVK